MGQFPSPPDERVTLDVLRRIHEGEDDAWKDLYDRYRDELLFAIRANLGPRLRSALQSEDVLQSVALAAFLAVPKFEDRGVGSLGGFLNRLMVNKIRDRARGLEAQKRRGSVPLTDALAAGVADESEVPTYHDPRYLELESGLRRLPAEMQEIILLRKVEGLSSKEAAERLGRSDAATRKLYSRALARLALLTDTAPGER